MIYKLLSKKYVIIFSIIITIIISSLIIIGIQPKKEVYAEKPNTMTIADGENISKHDFFEIVILLYEKLSNNVVSSDVLDEKQFDEIIRKSYTLGLLNEDDGSLYATDIQLSKQEAAKILYNIIINYDSNFVVASDEAEIILNDCYDNAMIYNENKISYAFMLKHGIIERQNISEPNVTLTTQMAADMANQLFLQFNKTVCFNVDGKNIAVGDSVIKLIKDFGMPSRVDSSEYGFEWYVYNSDYSNYFMVGVTNERICSFYSNSNKVSYNDVAVGDSYELAKMHNLAGLKFIFSYDGIVEAIYYNTDTHKKRITEKIRENQQLQIIDMLNCFRQKNKLPIYIHNESMTDVALQNSKSLTKSGNDIDIDTKTCSVRANDVFEIYKSIVSNSNYKNDFLKNKKEMSYIGVGVWCEDDILTATVLVDSKTKVKNTHEPTLYNVKFDKDTVKNKFTYGTLNAPIIVSPKNEEVFNYGTNLIIDLDDAKSSQYLIEIIDVERAYSIVHCYVTGGKTRFVFPAELFEDGIDYTIIVSTIDDVGNVLPSEEVTIVYGYAKPPIILSPTYKHSISATSIGVIWQKSIYSDFQVELFDENRNIICSTRSVNATQTQLDGLSVGKYCLSVSALRRDTNIVKSQGIVEFEITEPPIEYETQITILDDGTTQEQLVEKARNLAVGNPSFSSNRYANVFGNSLKVYSSKKEADVNMVNIKIPVWKLDDSGKKYSDTMGLNVNKAIAKEVQEIFVEIYQGNERFPIKSVGGYNWRNTATGGKSQHSYGTCVDINPDENYCVYKSGTTIGSFWKPYQNPYSITPNGDVMRAFKKYGWVWGGEWNSLKDYMHFSYLGG